MKKLILLFLFIPIIAFAYDKLHDIKCYERQNNVTCIRQPTKCTLEECSDKHNKCNTCVTEYICADGKRFYIKE